MTIVKFSKKYDNIIGIKKDFYTNNLKNLKNTFFVNKKYAQQKKRKFCKNCEKKIDKPLFKSFKIKYSVCSKCGHLNGMYEDSSNFAKWLYADNGGSNYSKGYLKDYDTRVKNIYLPKVKFLKDVIKKKIKLIDLGSGAGHFLKALELSKISATGIEINNSLVNLSKKKLKKNNLIFKNLNDVYNILENDNQHNVVSLINFLEHLEKPNKFIKSFCKSRLEYLYINVPLFSLSVFLENSFQNVFPRVLGEAHTHLYTKKSLEYLAKKNNLEIIAEWWFGQDFPDLYRSLMISSNNLNKKIYENHLNTNLFSVINDLQNVLDKNKISSEVHMIFKKKSNI